jgi:uncharacterized sulfatase
MKTTMKWLFSIGLTTSLAFSGLSDAQRVGAVGPHQEVTWAQGPATPAASKNKKPNIVLIVADDLGWNDLTFNGGGVAKGTVPTPNIDSIAKQGAIFKNGYSASGTCAPSRAAIMSGRYPTRFGFEFTPTPPQMLPMIARGAGKQNPPLITYFDEKKSMPYPDMGMPTEEISLAETLKGAGYHTAHIGKWHLGQANGMAPNDQGFDESLLMASGLYLPENDPNVVNSKQDFDPIDRFLWMGMQYATKFNDSKIFEPGGYITDYYTDEAVKVIEANKNRPFFLYLAHWAPHTPLQATKADYDSLSHIDNHTERVYAAMIKALDRGVGRVLDKLKAEGLEDNTLVMFTSDNGGAGYLGLPEVNEPFRGWKITYFEGGIHVPYFMKWPNKIKAGTTFDAPVHHFDIYATAAAAANATVPDDRPMDGANLLPYIGAEGNIEADHVPHEKLFWRGGHYQVAMSEGWKLHRADRPNKTWLFNMNEDPTEQNNLAEKYPDMVAKLSAMLDKHNEDQIEPAWPALLESPQFIDKTVNMERTELDEYVYWPN